MTLAGMNRALIAVVLLRGVILEGSRLSLLGQAYQSRIGEVEMSGDYMVLK
jgi:hypothetical protein